MGGSEQRDESFLSEVVIVRQDFGDAFPPHRLHRDGVGQAVPFIRAGFVEGQAGEERPAGLRANRDGRIGAEVADKVNDFPTEDRPGLAKALRTSIKTSSVVTRWQPTRARLARSAAWCHWSLRLVIAIQ